MTSAKKALSASELDETSYPEFRDHIRKVESAPVEHAARSYEGYPKLQLSRVRARLFTPLDVVLARRRSRRELGSDVPGQPKLSRILQFSHGALESDGRGPTPSSGKLCALELYLSPFAASWLPFETHHFDRTEHGLRPVAPSSDRAGWACDVPSLGQVDGGGLLFIVVGDVARVEAKYGVRSSRLLLLEAGHLMQNLCLVSESVGFCTVPLGGFFERRLAERLHLHETDAVLYAGVLG